MIRRPKAISGVDPRKLENIAWTVFCNGITLLSGLALMIILARYLGPERLAAYAWLLSLVSLMAPLALSAEPVATRLLVEKPESRDTVLGAILVFQVGGGVIGALLMILAASIGGPGATTTGMAIAAGGVLVGYGLTGIDAWFKSKELIKLALLPKAASQFAATVGGAVFAGLGMGLSAFLWLRTALSFAVAVAGAAIYQHQNGPGVLARLRLSTTDFKEVFSQGWPLVFAGLAAAAHMRVDQVMLGWMAPAAELANYSIAARFAEIMLLAPGMLHAVFFPSLVQANTRNSRGFDDHMQRYYDLNGLAGWAGALFLIAVIGSFLVPIVGEAYSDGTSIVYILACIIPIQCLAASRDVMLNIKGWTRLILAFSLFGLVLNVASNLFLIPTLGAQGAAFATVISACVSALATVAFKELRPAARGLARAFDPIGSMKRVALLSKPANDEGRS